MSLCLHKQYLVLQPLPIHRANYLYVLVLNCTFHWQSDRRPLLSMMTIYGQTHCAWLRKLSQQLHMENLHCDKIHFLISLDRIHCMTFLTCECVTLSDPTRDRMHSILKTPVTLQTSCGATPVQSCVLGLARWCAWSACVHHIWQSHRVTTSLQTTTTL